MALCYLRHDHGCCLSTRDVCLFAPLSVCIPVLYVLMYCVITGILYVLLLYVFYSYVLSLHDCIDAEREYLQKYRNEWEEWKPSQSKLQNLQERVFSGDIRQHTSGRHHAVLRLIRHGTWL